MNDQTITIPYGANLPTDGSTIPLARIEPGTRISIDHFALDECGLPAIRIIIAASEPAKDKQHADNQR